MKSLLKEITTGYLAVGLVLILSQPLKGQDNVTVCRAYGKVGKIISEFMLPMTVQDLINFINGSNPEVEREFVIRILDNVTITELYAIDQMDEEDKDFLFEMAGDQAMEILFQGRVTTPEAVGNQLYQQCTREGIDALIERMRRENTRLTI